MRTLLDDQLRTVRDLADLPGDLDYELVDGRVLVRSATPAERDLALHVRSVILAQCPPSHMVVVNQSVLVDDHNELRPDVVALNVESACVSPVPVQDVAIAVDIAPASDVRTSMDKAQTYARAHLSTYWVLDMSRRDISLTELVLDPGAQHYRFGIHTTEVFSVNVPWPVTIDLPALSRRRAALLNRSR